MLYPGILRGGVLLAAAVLLGGCGTFNSIFGFVSPPVGEMSVGYEPVREAGEPGDAFAVRGSSVEQSVNALVAALNDAGLTISVMDRRGGMISGFATRNALLDCGQVLVREGDGRAQIERPVAGNAEVAILPLGQSDGTVFLRREVKTQTRFRVDVSHSASGGDVVARVNETHRVTLKQKSLDGTTLNTTETITFGGSEIGEFSSGTTCTSSGEIRGILQK